MPIYTYQCPVCGRRWDEHRQVTESKEASEGICSCGAEIQGEPARGQRVPATFSVKFKGEGWTPVHFPNQRGNK